MAVTVLMHMKESSIVKHQHLENCIVYVLDEIHGRAKTEFGKWVGGNSGSDSKEIVSNFLQTKEAWEKMDGRQGYHFVISFEKGETTPEVAFSVIEEFCAEYLGDNYDYVFALHVDKEHLHGHIVFNSVSCIDGYKYQYKKGDWEKYIQPITDKVCIKNGLKPLVFEEKRIGMSYARWLAEKDGKIDWYRVIKADVDYAISCSSDVDVFFEVMNKMGYSLRVGHSKDKSADYITFSFIKPDGGKYSRRSYQLGKGYSPEDIAERIKDKSGSRSYEELGALLNEKASSYLKNTVSMKGSKTHKRLYQAVSYYKLPNPFAVPNYQVRSDMIRIEKLIEEVGYLKRNKITDVAQLQRREEIMGSSLKQLYIDRKNLTTLLETSLAKMDKQQLDLYEQYVDILEQMSYCKEFDKVYEDLEDELHNIEALFPEHLLEATARIEVINEKINKAKKEQKVIQRVLKDERGEELTIKELHVSK